MEQSCPAGRCATAKFSLRIQSEGKETKDKERTALFAIGQWPWLRASKFHPHKRPGRVAGDRKDTGFWKMEPALPVPPSFHINE